MRRVVSTWPMRRIFLWWKVIQPIMPTAPRTAGPCQAGGRSFSSIGSRRFNWRSQAPAIPDCYCVGQAQIGIRSSTSTRPATLTAPTLQDWTIADVTTSTFSPSPVMNNSYSGHHYFALDNLDRPRFLYQTSYTEAFYVYCDTACTSAANWWKYPINAAIFSDPIYISLR